MKFFAEHQEETLRGQADEARVYGDLLFFYAAQRDLAKLDGLATDLDPKNEADLLIFEIFQGTEPGALVQLASASTEPWVRHALMKAFLNRGSTEDALALWNKYLQWQVPDILTANVLLQYLLRKGHFEKAGNVAAVSLKLADKQRDVLLWKAMAQSRRVLDRDLYLDPMPRQETVTIAITTRDAAPYLDDTLAGIAGQSYPLAEVIVVDEVPGSLPSDLSALGPIRVVPAAPATSWIAQAAQAARTGLLVTLPPDCAPAVDCVGQYVLALENGAEGLACIGGRVEAFYQDKPGDRWRVARMTPEAPMQRTTTADAITSEALCLNRAAVLALGGEVPGDVAALARAIKASDGETLYLPEAVACCLRQDTIESALDAYWQHRLPDRMRAGAFASAPGLVLAQRAVKAQMTAFVNDDIDQGNSSLVFPDFYLFFHHAVLDLHYGVKRGVLQEGEARCVQDQLLGAIAPMDAEFKRDLQGKVRKMLGTRAITAPPAASLDAALNESLQEVVADLKTLFEAFPQDLYLAIYG